jgi:hypothetical protein
MMAFQKYTKADCDYGPGDWPEECGSCAHFDGHLTCKIVEGRIEEEMLCKFHVYRKGQEYLEENNE